MKRCRERGCETEVKGRQTLCYMHLLWRAEREKREKMTRGEQYPGVVTADDDYKVDPNPTPPLTGEIKTRIIK